MWTICQLLLGGCRVLLLFHRVFAEDILAESRLPISQLVAKYRQRSCNSDFCRSRRLSSYAIECDSEVLFS